jgi:diguanylate cyclase (GGDEF)-like protein/PAS domain S-box-containing protein
MPYKLRQENTQLPLPKSKQGKAKKPFPAGEPCLQISPSFEGAVFMIGENLSVRAVNKQAEPLLEFFFEKNTGLADFIALAFQENHINQTKLSIPDPDGNKSFDLFTFPSANAREVMVLAHDTTLQQNLISALMESRKLFKDLVACSSDFSWETNAQGIFQYVSPKGALSYTPEELVGRPARDILCAQDSSIIAFEAREAVDSQELWLRHWDGSDACVSISALPKLSRDGVWEGARGVCRDITTIRKQELALEKARTIEKLRLNIISAMRDLKAGEQMLVQTALAITEGLPGISCYIARQKGGGITFALDPKNVLPANITNAISDLEWQHFILNSGASHHPHMTNVEGREVMFMLTEYRHITNGVIFLTAADPEKGFSENTEEILKEAASHVGIAIDQINTHEDLERLSRTDELTGLLNRRAFMQDAEARMNSVDNQGAALLYLDLDNLKAVNDQAGHGTGDFVIASFGRRLKAITLHQNIAARIGGDEFLLWLDGSGRKQAEETALLLVDYCRSLGETTRNVTPALGLSVGITFLKPQQKVEISELIRAADAALYKAKESGKGTFILLEA